MKDQKGITLIALVITIIVLLILAGITIAMLTGPNGILSKASESSVQNAFGAAKDKVAILAADKVADYYKTVYVNTGSSTPYSDDTLDGLFETAITTETVAVDGITVGWSIEGSGTIKNKITLTYTKTGETKTGTLSKGAIKWD